MTKTVSLNDLTYSELAVLAGRLSMMAKKPISLGMTITFATAVFNRHLDQPSVEKFWKKMLSKEKIMTPEEFDIHWDEIFKVITGEKKKVGKAEVDKTS